LARSAIAKNGVSVQTRLTERLAPIEGDRVQLQQVMLNLVLNAAEAMSAVDKGARDLRISSDHARANDVRVVVRDSGPGIDPEHVESVFDAFYTTKSNGMGMGLSICRSIIEAHGGRLWADANNPRGAAFQFTLPHAQRSSYPRIESLAKTPREMHLIDGLAQETKNSIFERARSDAIVGVGRHEDCRNRVPCIDEAPVELESGHRGHLDVGDQAGRFANTRGCEEFARRRESFDGIAQ